MQCEAFDISCYLSWVFEEIEIFFLWVFAQILDGLVYVISLIPVPDFLENIQPVQVPDSISYLADIVQLEFGLLVVVTATTIRFVIRRIPIVG